ncbi:recombinase family protein [Jeotgalibacillus haloalkalitolerans]|uniref:Recombinase family protein n=1 Tax=Jeotgalibacillus haloalkalitolerans TaxID=3104292 RepID=A0ABU5KQN7_9BACL|nr:recombinase family protein [Jeotgalibacillus sp. HH7-29]MDZ5713557.1 recombinase family protein [Jeotgalibacillus sp. HH7-29]
MALIGYARVSSVGQSLESQVEQLKAFGCKRIFKEKESGAKSDRKELQAALEFLEDGELDNNGKIIYKDKLIVTKIDRLARSTFDLQRIAGELKDRKVGLQFLKENIDFSTPSGELMFTMLGAIGQFERDIIKERTTEGRERAKLKGKHMGRPSKPKKNIERAMVLYNEREDNGMSVNDISKLTDVPRSTIYAEIKKNKISLELKV